MKREKLRKGTSGSNLMWNSEQTVSCLSLSFLFWKMGAMTPARSKEQQRRSSSQKVPHSYTHHSVLAVSHFPLTSGSQLL